MTSSTPTQSDIPDNAVTQKDVIKYLNEHPHFLIEHTEDLNIEALSSNQDSSSIVHKQLSKLRDTNATLTKKLNELIPIAKQNETLFQSTQTAILMLCSCTSQHELISQFNDCMTHCFDIDCAQLTLYSKFFNDVDPQYLEDIDHAPEEVTHLITHSNITCGQLRDSERQYLFTAYKDEIHSAAIIPLNYNNQQIGRFCLGSKDLHYFQTGSNTDFVRFIASYLSKRLTQLSNSNTQ
jgi:uncharacterized protein